MTEPPEQKTFAEVFEAACVQQNCSLGFIATRLKKMGAQADKSTLMRWRNGDSQPSNRHIETIRCLPRAMLMNREQSHQFLREAGRALKLTLVTETAGPATEPLVGHRLHFGSDSGHPSDFGGRSKELVQLEKWVRPSPTNNGARSVAIVGLGGVGKTRLAQELLQRVAGDFPHGCETLTLTPHQSSLEVVRNVAHLLEIQAEALKEQRLEAALEQMRLQLHGVQMLFLVDNVERADQVRILARGLPQITWIFTARRISLKNIVAHALHLHPPPTAEAVEIFTRMAPNAMNGQGEHAAAVVNRLGRLPLALRIAAALLENEIMESPAELLDWLQTRGLLGSRSLNRQVHELCDSLLAMTPPDAQRLFELCGLFAQPRLPLRQVVKVARRLGLAPAAGHWETLGDLALVEFTQTGDVALHPLLYEYARTRLKSRPEYAAAWQALQQTMIERAEEVAFTPDESQRDYWQLLNEEADLLNVGQALHQAQDWDGLKRIFPAVTGYLWSVGNTAEYIRFEGWCRDAAVASGDRLWEASACADLGFVYYDQHHWEEAEALYWHSLKVADGIEGALLEQARVRRYMSLLRRSQGQGQVALALLAEAEARLERARHTGDSRLPLATLWLHSAKMGAYYLVNDLERAAAEGEQAQKLHGQITQSGGYRSMGFKITLGDVYWAQGRVEKAVKLWEEMLEQHGSRPPISDHADVRLRLAWVYAHQEEVERALEMVKTAERLYTRFGNMAGVQNAERLRASIESETDLPEYREMFG